LPAEFTASEFSGDMRDKRHADSLPPMLLDIRHESD